HKNDSARCARGTLIHRLLAFILSSIVEERERSCRTCDVEALLSQTFFVGAGDVIRCGVECFFIVIGTEIVCRALENRLWSCGRVDIHSTHRTKRMFGAGNRCRRVDLIRFRIHPAKPLIFHVVGSLLRDLAAEIALDDAEREIDSGGESPRTSNVAILDESRSALQVDIRKLVSKTNKRTVKCGRGFT